MKPADIETAKPSPAHPAGLYERGASIRAINLAAIGDALETDRWSCRRPRACAASNRSRRSRWRPGSSQRRCVLFLADCLIALFLSGAWSRLKMRNATAVLLR